MKSEFDLVVIGGGPGGYVAALRAAQLGLSVGVVEKEPQLGGTCLRVGCIPSKALLESSLLYHEAKKSFAQHGVKVGSVEADLPAMLQRKTTIVDGLAKGITELFRRAKIERVEGTGSLAGSGKVLVTSRNEKFEWKARHILLATGSRAAPLRGVSFDGDRVVTSTEALSFTKVPSSLVVIGAGAIGLELGSVWNRLGSKVTVLEYLDRILPEMDGEIAAEAKKLLGRQGLDFRLSSRVTGVKLGRTGCTVEVEGAEPISAERVLVAVGRIPNTEGLNLESVGVRSDERGRIEIDESFRTSVDGIFAIGDCVRGPMLAHKAQDEGVAVAERIAHGKGITLNLDLVPSVVYTEPEVAGVGKTEEALRSAGVRYRKGTFAYRANARARILNHVDGLAKVLADEKTDRVLGVHLVGTRAGDLVAEAAAALAFGASSEDIARVCHAHPTLSEILKEASLAVTSHPLHS